MKLNLQKENLHHAYLLEGEREEIFKGLKEFIETELKIKTVGNPNFWYSQFDSFGIDDGRILKELQMNKVAHDDLKVFVVALNTITREAQNSLLKMFEEPTAQTHFFIIAPSLHSFLPTLKSRLQIIPVAMFQGLALEQGKAFINASKVERLKMVKEISEAVSDEEKIKTEVMAFVGALEIIFRETKNMAQLSPEDVVIFNELIRARDYLHDRSSSVKLVLENLALII